MYSTTVYHTCSITSCQWRAIPHALPLSPTAPVCRPSPPFKFAFLSNARASLPCNAASNGVPPPVFSANDIAFFFNLERATPPVKASSSGLPRPAVADCAVFFKEARAPPPRNESSTGLPRRTERGPATVTIMVTINYNNDSSHSLARSQL